MSEFKELLTLLEKFRDERDWKQFHDSKNLALALSIEAAELNELFLWKNEPESEEVDRQRLREELADVFAYALMLAGRHGLDVSEIVKEISRIRLERVDSELLKNAKAKYVGSFIRNAENPQTIAGYALNIKLNNLDDDYYESFLENINSVNEADVKRAANKYFKIA